MPVMERDEDECEGIHAVIERGDSLTAVARRQGRSASTVCPEVARKGGVGATRRPSRSLGRIARVDGRSRYGSRLTRRLRETRRKCAGFAGSSFLARPKYSRYR